MKEIEFRGKSDNRWKYGYLIAEDELNENGRFETIYKITDIDSWKYEIQPDTIGQYTGLKDKNGKKIFEGDIVIAHYFFQNYDPITLGAFEDEDEITGKIINDLDGFRVIDRTDECRQLPLSMIQEAVEELEVIGNIYDNPELLGE